MSDSSNNNLWSSKLGFILAASGSAVGLGNMWKFPYEAGQGGGGAFVLVYVICVALIGLPLLISEISLGRRGGKSPSLSIKACAEESGANPYWGLAGAIGVLASFLVLAFYNVIGGWSLSYLYFAITEGFGDITAASSEAH
ncbi:MAG: sodium-dependent transporter, partial [Sinobacterium sp.]